jgi:hypothetical protein
MEAVFRHLFERGVSADQWKPPAYFLTVDGKDPSDVFLARFSGHTPPVGPGSRFVPVDEGIRKRVIGRPRVSVKTKERAKPRVEFPHRRGVHFRIEEVRRVDENTFEMTGHCHMGNLATSRCQYRATWEAGKWKVEAFGSMLVS